MKKKILAVLIMLLTGSLFMSDTSFAAWTQPKGHAYNQLTFSYYITNEKFTTINTDESGEITGIGGVETVSQPEFKDKSITYYGEYGITDKLTVFVTIPQKWSISDDTQKYSGENGPSGIGDINAGLRYNLSQNLFGSGILMSLQGTLKIPEAYKYGNPLTHLSLGDGQYDGTIALLFGKGYAKGYAWLNAGYKCRFENTEYSPLTFDPSDQVKISIGGGYPVTSWLSIRGLIDWTTSVGNASVSDELIIENYKYGGLAKYKEHILIRDTLALEPNFLNAGIGLAFNTSPKTQIVLSYGRDLLGKDYSLGQTYSLAFVYMH